MVAAVGLTPGTASGGSISLIGSGGATVTVEVPATSIARVVAGEQADVTPPGALAPVAGAVQQVSLLPAQSSTTSSVATYPVVIAVAQPTPTLAAGSRASASILLGTADGVVTVPNSAITTTSATTGVVTLVSGSTTTRTPVTLGIIGATRTQIVKGVKVGQQVLLADPTQPLPTSSSTTTRFGGGGFGGTGGFGGGGFGGAGGFGGGSGRRAVSGVGG